MLINLFNSNNIILSIIISINKSFNTNINMGKNMSTPEINRSKQSVEPIIPSKTTSSSPKESLKDLMQKKVEKILSEQQLDVEWVKIEHEDDWEMV